MRRYTACLALVAVLLSTACAASETSPYASGSGQDSAVVTPGAPSAQRTGQVDTSALPVPSLTSILPAGLPQGLASTGTAATPTGRLTAGYTAPDGEPVVALDALAYGVDPSWAVTAVIDGWVQVLVPFGRGALPSQDSTLTNHVAAWVRESEVLLEPAPRAVVDLSDRTLTLEDGRVLPVGIGTDATPTPTGLCAVAMIAFDPLLDEDVLVTTCQSLAMDEFAGGTGYAVIGLHADPEGGAAVGRATTNGCVRLHPQDFATVMATLTPGSVIDIKP